MRNDARRRPRILAVLQLPPPIHGASVMNAVVAESVAIRTQYSLEVVPLRYAKSLSDIGRPSIRKAITMLFQWLALIARSVFRRPDATYFTLAPSGWALGRDLAFASVFKALRIPLVYHIHGSGIAQAARNPILRGTIRWAFRHETVIHLSPSLGRELSGLVDPSHIRILPNGVAAPKHSSGGTGRESVKVIFCSNMMPEKGPFLLVEALGIAARRGVALRAEFAGPAVSGEFEELFWRACATEGIRDRVIWNGAQYGEAKEELFASADIFAFPTYYGPEGVPLVVLEAMSYGLPCVVADQGGIRDILQDGVSGYVVPSRDSLMLAERLTALAQDGDLRKAIGSAARKAYQERFTLRRFEEDLIGIWAEAVS